MIGDTMANKTNLIAENKLNIRSNEYELDYVYGDPAMLVLPPEKKLDFPEPEIPVTTINLSRGISRSTFFRL